MAMRIADTATVDPAADLADGVEIGPYCVVGPDVRIGPGTRLIAHVCLLGSVRMGGGNLIGPFSVLGAEPDGGPLGGRVEVGEANTIREGTSIEAGSVADGGTRIGSRNVIGPHVAIARDAWIGDSAAIGSGVRIGATGRVESFAEVSAGVDLHPGATIGEHAFAVGPARIVRDVPRFTLVEGSPSRVRGINLLGLRRHGFSRSEIRPLREACRLLGRAGMELDDAARDLVDRGLMTPEVIRLMESLYAQRAGRHGRARDARRRPPQAAGAAGVGG